MRIDVQIDNTQLLLRMRNGEKRLAYGVVNALKKTALRVQEAEREKVEEEFTLRKKEFVLRQAAIIKPFANVRQARPFTEIAVGRKDRLLLGEFEAGGTREPFTPGAERVAVPLTGGTARPTFASPVPASMRLVRLGIEKRVAKTGTVQLQGKQRTFVLKSTAKAPDGGVFQRVGPKPEDIRLRYSYKKHPLIKPSLEFVRTAQATADVWFKEEMQRQVLKAIEFSRGRGL